MHFAADRVVLGRMIEGVLQLRQELAYGLPLVCRGRLGNPTLAPEETPLAATEPDATGNTGSVLFADWTAGFLDQRNTAPNVEPVA
eukprot:13340795-Alexandrium_andersonii.AAC.1